MEFTKFETVSIRNHPELNERWVQDCIAENPSVLGLGDIVLKDRERIQPWAGRPDLLLQDSESTRGGDTKLKSSLVQLMKAILSGLLNTVQKGFNF
jgi:hypothetical protein